MNKIVKIPIATAVAFGMFSYVFVYSAHAASPSVIAQFGPQLVQILGTATVQLGTMQQEYAEDQANLVIAQSGLSEVAGKLQAVANMQINTEADREVATAIVVDSVQRINTVNVEVTGVFARRANEQAILSQLVQNFQELVRLIIAAS